jgi:hypothetical protein
LWRRKERDDGRYVRRRAAEGPTGQQARVRFLVDSGVTYTLVPHDVWKALGLVPKRTVTFTLADGTPVSRVVSECHLALPQGDAHIPVILGEPGDEASRRYAGNPGPRAPSIQAHAGAEAHATCLIASCR